MQRRERERFAADELAVVLSHYDLGVIESITEFPRGSRRSPKVGIVSERGKFLLKKRAKTGGGAERARYVHAIQCHLMERGFPLPALISPVRSGDTVLILAGSMYELFDYVSGHPYTGDAKETRDAGRILASFHEAMDDFNDDRAFQGTGYHDALAVQTGLNSIPSGISSHESAAGKEAEILGLTSYLFDVYSEAAGFVDGQSFDKWPTGITHSDWHPGNLLFKRQQVMAVIDYDCAKEGKALCDIANGALQFSMTSGREPHDWPDHLDMLRVREFILGYQGERPMCDVSMKVFPYLMLEALIAESVLPIAATGSFGPFDGFGFLRMVRRKVEWIRNHVAELQKIV